MAGPPCRRASSPSAWPSTATPACSSASPASACSARMSKLFSWPLSDTHDPLVAALHGARADGASQQPRQRPRPAPRLRRRRSVLAVQHPAARRRARTTATPSGCCWCGPARRSPATSTGWRRSSGRSSIRSAAAAAWPRSCASCAASGRCSSRSSTRSPTRSC